MTRVLFLAFLFSCSIGLSQELSIPGSETEETESGRVEETEIPSSELDQVRRYMIFKVRPAAMLMTPLVFNAFRNLNGELEIGVSNQLSLSVGGNFTYLDGGSLSTYSTTGSLTRWFSLRLDTKYYFKKNDPKDTHYSMEGWFIGSYYKWGLENIEHSDLPENDRRSMINVVGFLGGYQWIIRKGISITPLAGFGAGVAAEDYIVRNVRIDGRAGVSIGFTPF